MSASRDANRVPTLLAVLNTDGVTVTNVQGIATSNRLSVSDGTTGSDHGLTISKRDSNRIPVLMAVSSADGLTPIEVYCDSSGRLLVNSN